MVSNRIQEAMNDGRYAGKVLFEGASPIESEEEHKKIAELLQEWRNKTGKDYISYITIEKEGDEFYLYYTVEEYEGEQG